MKTLLKLMLVLLVAAALAAAGVWFGWVAPRVASLSVHPQRSEEPTLEVPAGASLRTVLVQLERAGHLQDARVAYYYARYHKLGAPKAGEYRFARDASALDMLAKMRRGEVVQYELGFPEGLTYKEIAPRLEASGLLKAADVIALCQDAAFLKENGVPGKSCEGYLFPDTYRVAKGKSPRELVAMLIQHHHTVFKKHVEPLAAASKLSAHEIVTLASIVEKETGAEVERPHIAGLFLNRLRIGMPLQTDPTVIYAVTLAKGSFDGNIHRSDLLLDHPYNTYKVKGLPPGPISNPGLKALLAVVKPQQSDDLYFVSKNDGTHIFCPTLVCHNAAVKTWQIEYFKKKRGKR